ncbi:MAG: hypothetical protein A2284_04305 [Deltaproteobacteria bacterium RIFOXYA12_FULL_61_11]|nr:MAG: hypothetical protein A2284_04305 [Deltaproteobacteria bacterium RIFOXYA12_FULL_61_11]
MLFNGMPEQPLLAMPKPNIELEKSLFRVTGARSKIIPIKSVQDSILVVQRDKDISTQYSNWEYSM